MTHVVAISTGYFGGVVREPGDEFEVPDDLWSDKKRRPSWAKMKRAKVSDDDDAPDNIVATARPVDDASDRLAGMTVKQLRDYAAEHAIDIKGLSSKDDILAAVSKGTAVEDAGADVFADAPEPVEVKGNGVAEALPVEPDWIAPKPID